MLHRVKKYCCVWLPFIAMPASAHHSDAMYDRDQSVELRGTVVEFQWRNPHVHILIEVEGDDGQPTIWAIEGSTPAFMGRWGWTRETLSAGDAISVMANPLARPGRSLAFGRSVSMANGTQLTIPQAGDRDEAPARHAIASSIEGRWLSTGPTSPPQLALQFFQPLQYWPLTEAGAAAASSYDDTQNNPHMECVLETLPVLMLFPLVHNIEIGENFVTIRSEGYAERIVRLDAASHDAAPDSHHGHSIGWWEDDVLVVDTTNFTLHRAGNAIGGVPSSESKHLIERFELSDDRTRLLYSFQLEDPAYLAEAVAGTTEFTYRPDLPDVAYVECDLESARRFADGTEARESR